MKFKVGDRVRVTTVDNHKNEVGTVIGISSYYIDTRWPYTIHFSDGTTQIYCEEELIKEEYMFNVGDIVVDKHGIKNKVLAVCGEITALSENGEFNLFGGWYTKTELKEYETELVKEETTLTMQEIADKFGVDVDTLKVEKGEQVKKVYILYDGRAIFGDTDDATVLETQDTKPKYNSADSIWYEYDKENDVAVNGRQMMELPTKEEAK